MTGVIGNVFIKKQEEIKLCDKAGKNLYDVTLLRHVNYTHNFNNKNLEDFKVIILKWF